MDKPMIAETAPKAAELKAGSPYYWCACGRSGNQPFCDGSHRGTKFEPKQFVAEADGEAYLCMCKRTGNPPYCDGTHASISDEEKAEYAAKPEPLAPRATPKEPTV